MVQPFPLAGFSQWLTPLPNGCFLISSFKVQDKINVFQHWICSLLKVIPILCNENFNLEYM
jgi:hypothetical protein